jgi:cadmium resistance protein CadD (predicted permease)
LLIALTFALAYASTNFDNLAVMLGLAPSAGAKRAAAAFVLTQGMVIAAAFAAGAAAGSLPAAWLGWLGLVPIALGLRELWKGFRHDDPPERETRLPKATGLTAMMLTFVGLSADTFALTAALLADSSSAFDLHVLAGAIVGVVAIAVAGMVASRAAARARAVVERLERIVPFVMIASGIYILADTATDVL